MGTLGGEGYIGVLWYQTCMETVKVLLALAHPQVGCGRRNTDPPKTSPNGIEAG